MRSSSPRSWTVFEVSVSSSCSRRAVVPEHEVVLGEHVGAQDVLLVRELVADQLEDDVEGGQGEADHHQSLLARGQHELVVRVLQVAEELAVALGLALLGAAEHGVELAHRLARQDVLQELHDLAHVGEVDVEVRAREAEEHADRALVEHDRVDQHAAVLVAQRHDERQRPAAASDAADQVRAGHLVEDFLDDLQPLDGAPLAAALERRLQLVGHHLHAALEVAVWGAEAEVGEQFLDQQLDGAAVDVDLGLDVRRDVRERVEVERHELDRRVDAHGAEGLPRDRAEERLREVVVRQRVDDLGEAALDARPDRALVHVLAEHAVHDLDRAVHVLRVQPDALDRVALAAAPVAFLEALSRPLRDRAELRVVVRERVDQSLRAVLHQLVARARPGGRKIQEVCLPFPAAHGAPTGCGSARPRTRCT